MESIAPEYEGAPAIRGLFELGRSDLASAGGKGANLGELMAAGLPVPPGFVITTAAYREFVTANQIAANIVDIATSDAGSAAAAARIADLFRAGTVPDHLREQIVAAYAALSDDTPDRPVAVRSSATAEDLADASFAGQQESYLNVRGSEDLLAAVRDCWASLWTERALTYRARQEIDPSSVALAVVVQQMVDAESAGVMFTANPANGRRDQLVISAAWGLGEAVVSGAVDTDNLVVEGTRIISRDTAQKSIMVGYADHRTEERAIPVDRRSAVVLDDDAARELTELGRAAERHFGAPQDIEWARADGQFFLVQSRPITALPEPEGPVPTDWPVPNPSGWYFRASIVEQLPDPLSPLFADLAKGSVTRSLQKLMGELLGPDVIHEDDVSLPTINGYAYYEYSRRGMIRVSLRMYRAFPVLASGRQSGMTRWREVAHPRYVEIVRNWSDRPVPDLPPAELMAGVVELLDAGTEYYTAVQTIIPVAASSEVIFTRFYRSLVQRAGDPPPEIFVLGGDSSPIRAEKSLWDLAAWTRTQPELMRWLLDHSAADAAVALGSDTPAGLADAWAEWAARLQAHLDTYGHAVYNLDFVNPVPADQPEPVIETLRFYLSGQGSDPRLRQEGLIARRDQATAQILPRLDPVRRRSFLRLLRWTQTAGPVREDALADVGLAWPMLRRLALELGRRLVHGGTLTAAEDVFWLTRSEIEAELAEPTGSRSKQIEQRKAVWRGQRRATPPQVLPKGRWTMLFDSMLPAASETQTGRVIRGIGGSAGKVTGPARVLSGPADFDQMRPGDILVAQITTPAWTTLFAMAGGVVTDVGGPLSHSSIVAREYGIPAVLGTGVATRRITSGEQITVDGDAGTVTLSEGAGDNDQEPESSRSLRPLAYGAAAVGAVLAVRALRHRTQRD
ncbi:MAG TPA: PEP/pyruvate-binding domain-containing protein [Propionibacteriaceae bacterium]|nr:PEP/pyruvate-binding domain-containing protein [Propionibacteriaceae bacterium]